MKQTAFEQRCHEAIDNLTQIEMARLWRFAPAGHPFMDSQSLIGQHFMARFNQLGGFTPAVSKEVGWSKPDRIYDPVIEIRAELSDGCTDPAGH